MNILVSNQQISDEARKVLYGLNTFTIEISDDDVTFLRKSEDVWRYPALPFTPSLQYLKHWDIQVTFVESPGQECLEGDIPQYPQLIFRCHDDTNCPPYVGEAMFTVVE